MSSPPQSLACAKHKSRQRRPQTLDIDIDLRLADAFDFVNLIEERTDVALRIGHLPDRNLAARKVGEIRHIVCASPSYLSERGTPTHPRELPNHDCITFKALHSSTKWTFTRGRRIEKIPIRSRLSVSTAEAAVDAAVAGLGITPVLYHQALKPIDEGRLKIMFRDFEPTPLPVHLVYSESHMVPKKLRAFLDFILPRLKGKLVFDA
jgi:DNA-binding transcriptional LysR family regulator